MTEKLPEDENKKKDTMVELGKFYFLNGKYGQALKEFEKALEINARDPEIFYHLGLIHESCNDISQAQDAYEKALSFAPDHKLARKHLNRVVGLDEEDPSPGK